ncbi:hypothetical protein DFH06DRAFT_170906 [Mycena polygramma]|nr:hypothetical protein DFH06DRAFT_170906 [Mycena polygramma]
MCRKDVLTAHILTSTKQCLHRRRHSLNRFSRPTLPAVGHVFLLWTYTWVADIHGSGGQFHSIVRNTAVLLIPRVMPEISRPFQCCPTTTLRTPPRMFTLLPMVTPGGSVDETFFLLGLPLDCANLSFPPPIERAPTPACSSHPPSLFVCPRAARVSSVYRTSAMAVVPSRIQSTLGHRAISSPTNRPLHRLHPSSPRRPEVLLFPLLLHRGQKNLCPQCPSDNMQSERVIVQAL